MNQQASATRVMNRNHWLVCIALTIVFALSGTGCNRSGDKTDSGKKAGRAAGPATFANAKLNTADSIALVEISSLGQLHRQLLSFYDQFAGQDQTNAATLQQYLEVVKNALGFNPRNLAEVEKATGINFSKPVSCSLRIPHTELGNPLPIVTFALHVPISDPLQANKLIGNLTRLAGFTVKKENTGKPTIYSLRGKNGFAAETWELFAYSIENQVLTVLFSGMDILSGTDGSEARYLAEHLLQAKAKPLNQVKHFQQTLPYLAADNQLRLFVNIKSLVKNSPLNRSPVSALANNFEAFGFTAGTQQLQAALRLANPAGVKKYLQPGDGCQQLLATADKPLAAFSASLDNPLGLFDYLLQYMDPRSWNRDKGRMQQELGVSYDQLSNLTTKGSGALLVYPAPEASNMAISGMGVVKTTDRNLTQHLLQQLAQEEGFNAIKYGKNTVWRANTSQRRGPIFAFALLDNHVLAGTAVSQIHNLVNKKGSGWKPSVGGKELVAGEVDLTSVLQWLATHREIPNELRPNLFKVMQKFASKGIQLKLKAAMEDSTLVASVNLKGTTWPDGLATIAEASLQGSLEPLNQSALKLPKLHPVQGRVTLDGKPLAGARVALHQVDGEREASRVFAATSDSQGNYQIAVVYSTGTYPGAPIGGYKVTVIKVADAELSEEEFDQKYQNTLESLKEDGEPVGLDNPAYLVDERYTSVRTTPLQLDVQEGRNSFDLELTSKPSPNN